MLRPPSSHCVVLVPGHSLLVRGPLLLTFNNFKISVPKNFWSLIYDLPAIRSFSIY